MANRARVRKRDSNVAEPAILTFCRPLPLMMLVLVAYGVASLALDAVGAENRGGTLETAKAASQRAGKSLENVRESASELSGWILENLAGAKSKPEERTEATTTRGHLPLPRSRDEYCSEPQDCASAAWSREGAARCSVDRCLSTSNWTSAVLRNDPRKAAGFEDTLANATEAKWGWPTKEAIQLRFKERFAGKRCSVVGGAPFTGNSTDRSASIDEDDLTIRVNLALPFQKHQTTEKQLQENFGNGDASLGLGTKTNMLVLNWIALKKWCFTSYNNERVRAHLSGATMLIMIHEVEHIDMFLRCRKKLRETQPDIFLVPLHPQVRLEDERELQQTLLGSPEATRQKLFPGARTPESIPFATTGISAVNVALRICGAVRTFGLRGDIHHTLKNVQYNPTSFHALAVERLTLKRVRECRALKEGGLCRKLVDFNR